MKRIAKMFWLQFVLFIMIFPITSPQAKPISDDVDEEETILVGRISHVEGQLLRYVPDEKEWVATVADAPFYTDDILHSGEKGRAEFIMPNNTWVRIDGDTQIQLNALKDDVIEVDVASGLARFHNKGSYAIVRATTPFGHVVAPEKTSFDLYVGDESVEVVALKGKVDFFHGTSETRFEVIPGAPAIIADSWQVTAGKDDVDTDWDRWNRDREHLWATRNRVGEESVKYLPPNLSYEAHALEEHGRWERVYYDGGYSYFWRPVYVGVGWAPFTAGRWTVRYGENTWIPHEPFGYVTHHYGNWIFLRGFWYWAPPVARVRVGVGFPLLEIGFAWYPGRVAWIHSGGYIGWVPLAPYEPYYCYRRWGPRAIVVKNVNIINLNINRYKYVKHAVIINQNKLYTVRNYRKARVRNIKHATLVKNYRVAPVLNNRVIKNYNNMRERYDFTDVRVRSKPHRPVNKTIQQRHLVLKQGVDNKDKTVRQNITDVRRSKFAGRVAVRSPRTKVRLAPTNQLNRRMAEREFYEKKHKKGADLRTGARMRATKEKQKSRRQMPVESVRQKKVRAEDQSYARKNVRKVQRKSSPLPVRQQEVRTEDPSYARKEVQRVQRRPSPQPVKQRKVQAEDQGKGGPEEKKQRYKEESYMESQNRSSPQAQGNNYRKDGSGERQSRNHHSSSRNQDRRRTDSTQRSFRGGYTR
jgi:hypothetical protein